MFKTMLHRCAMVVGPAGCVYSYNSSTAECAASEATTTTTSKYGEVHPPRGVRTEASMLLLSDIDGTFVAPFLALHLHCPNIPFYVARFCSSCAV